MCGPGASGLVAGGLSGYSRPLVGIRGFLKKVPCDGSVFGGTSCSFLKDVLLLSSLLLLPWAYIAESRGGDSRILEEYALYQLSLPINYLGGGRKGLYLITAVCCLSSFSSLDLFRVV